MCKTENLRLIEKCFSIWIIKPSVFTTSQKQYSGQQQMSSCLSLHPTLCITRVVLPDCKQPGH